MKKKPIVLCGDFNVYRDPIDIYIDDPKKWDKYYHPREVENFHELLDEEGLVDIYREFHPDTVAFTYWGFRH